MMPKKEVSNKRVSKRWVLRREVRVERDTLLKRRKRGIVLLRRSLSHLFRMTHNQNKMLKRNRL